MQLIFLAHLVVRDFLFLGEKEGGKRHCRSSVWRVPPALTVTAHFLQYLSAWRGGRFMSSESCVRDGVYSGVSSSGGGAWREHFAAALAWRIVCGVWWRVNEPYYQADDGRERKKKYANDPVARVAAAAVTAMGVA